MDLYSTSCEFGTCSDGTKFVNARYYVIIFIYRVIISSERVYLEKRGLGLLEEKDYQTIDTVLPVLCGLIN